MSHKPSALKRHKRWHLLALLSCIALVFLLRSVWLASSPGTRTQAAGTASRASIPNTVHFVRQMNREGRNGHKPLRFEFRHFLAYYSAHHYLKPNQINIWTDATADDLAEARANGDAFTKALFKLPEVIFHHIEMPNRTTKGIPLHTYAHKSDFVRTRIMAKYGGQYLDDDAWIIRDLAPLREAGFDNVFGRQAFGDICQAMWMSSPDNELMRAFEQLQEIVFNGEWTKAGNRLITNLVRDIKGYSHDRHALVLEQDAFFPGSWELGRDGLPMFYQVHPKAGEDETVDTPGAVQSIQALVERYADKRNLGWRRDWRDTYVIHGWSNNIRSKHKESLFDPYGGFTPRYVWARESNIARALFPALQAAIQAGVLPADIV